MEESPSSQNKRRGPASRSICRSSQPHSRAALILLSNLLAYTGNKHKQPRQLHALSNSQARCREQLSRQAGTHKSLASENCIDRRQQIPSRVGFEDVPKPSAAQSLFGNIEGAIFSHEEDFGFWRNLLDATSSFNSIKCRKADVHQDKVQL